MLARRLRSWRGLWRSRTSCHMSTLRLSIANDDVGSMTPWPFEDDKRLERSVRKLTAVPLGGWQGPGPFKFNAGKFQQRQTHRTEYFDVLPQCAQFGFVRDDESVGAALDR
ncbi:hypothetical protein BJ165DRAFT_1397469 [Panaeolus papilionaceus]|nr:hypothetical protein BJ165DRAFT_1397469 [Panaeolus papilionaceus]